jgi:serine/threonine protein kinase
MAAPDPLIGHKLGDYTILSLLGKGGMARVYRGYDENLDRYAAIKVISGDFATTDEKEYNERFLKEARAIARLNHTNIVGVYQFGHADSVYYMAMHFLDGEDLRAILRRLGKLGQRMPASEILRMARDMASALDYAHSQGVVHRDIKPSNIMITSNNKSVLTDFGLALSVPEGTMGDTFGTAHYIAPEQAISSANAVPQSDLYSLGVVLYEAFAGQVPFDEPSAMSVALKHLNELPPPPSLYNPTLSNLIEKVLLRTLHKDPKGRYQTGKELIEALEVALRDGEEDTAHIPRSSHSLHGLNSLQTDATPPPGSAAAFESYLKAVTDSQASRPTPAFSSSGVPETVRFPSEFSPPYGSAPYPPSMLYPPQQRSNWPIFLGILLVLVVGLGIFAFLWSAQDDGNNDTDIQAAIVNARRTEIAQNQADTQTAIALFTDTSTPTETPTSTTTPTASDTPTNTPLPTDTPSSTPTDTPTPTLTPTDTPSPTEVPSNTPTTEATEANSGQTGVSATPLPPDVRLIYSEDWLLITNIAGQTVDISQLRFTQTVEERVFEFAVGTGLAQATNANRRSTMPVNTCFQIVVSNGASNDDISAYCPQRLGWVQPSSNSLFWLDRDGESGTFEVFLRRRKIADCTVGEGFCEFSTQQPLIIVPSTPAPVESESTEELVATVEATEEPIEEITEEPTEVVTEEPTEAVTEAAITAATEESFILITEEAIEKPLRLVYDETLLYLLNTSSETLDISDIVFEQRLEDRTLSFAVAEWSTLEQGAVDEFESGACYRLVTTSVGASRTPEDCLRNLGWIQRSAARQFWLPVEDGPDHFVVLLGDEELAECEIGAGVCEIALP